MIKNDNTLWAVGSNGFGQLGTGTTDQVCSFVQVTTDKSNIKPGSYHSLIMKMIILFGLVAETNLANLAKVCIQPQIQFMKKSWMM